MPTYQEALKLLNDAYSAGENRQVFNLSEAARTLSTDRGEAVCPTCDGSGRMGGDGSPDPCDDCNATGRLAAPSPAASAAPSGVSDAMVERACEAYQAARWTGRRESMSLTDAAKHRTAITEALQAAIQPQPGRVEGMTWTDFDTMRHMLHCIAPVGEFTGKKTILRDSVIDIVSRFCRESASTAGGAS
jgi:hypothetical protein